MKKSIILSVVLAAFVLVVGVVTAIANEEPTTEARSRHSLTATPAVDDSDEADDSDDAAKSGERTYRFGHLDEVLDEMVDSGDLSQELADEIRSRVRDKIRESAESRSFGSGMDGQFNFRLRPFADRDGLLGDLSEFFEDGELTDEEREQLLDRLREQEWFSEIEPFVGDLSEFFEDGELSDEEREQLLDRLREQAWFSEIEPFVGDLSEFLQDGDLTDEERADLREQLQEQFGEGFEGFDFEFDFPGDANRRFGFWGGDRWLPDDLQERLDDLAPEASGASI